MKYSHDTILTASEKLLLPSFTNRPAWLAWSHEMKGLFAMMGNFYEMKPAFEQDRLESLWRTSYEHYDIDWDYPTKSYELVVAQNMIVASIAPEWKMDDTWRELNLYSNPIRLWKYLEKVFEEGKPRADLMN